MSILYYNDYYLNGNIIEEPLPIFHVNPKSKSSRSLSSELPSSKLASYDDDLAYTSTLKVILLKVVLFIPSHNDYSNDD